MIRRQKAGWLEEKYSQTDYWLSHIDSLPSCAASVHPDIRNSWTGTRGSVLSTPSHSHCCMSAVHSVNTTHHQGARLPPFSASVVLFFLPPPSPSRCPPPRLHHTVTRSLVARGSGWLRNHCCSARDAVKTLLRHKQCVCVRVCVKGADGVWVYLCLRVSHVYRQCLYVCFWHSSFASACFQVFI